MIIRFTPADGRRALQVPIDGIRYVFMANADGELECDVRDTEHAKYINSLLGLEDVTPLKQKPETPKVD